MSDDPPPIELVPHGVVRAAAWPVETILRFGESALDTGDSGDGADTGDDADTDSFLRRYEEALLEERCRLREIASTDEFQRALAMAAPELPARWSSLPSDPALSVKARHRRLEATVMRYLLRAAGRPTPQGAWAGVTRLHRDVAGTGLRIEPAEVRWQPSVNLIAVGAIVDAIARERRYCRVYPVRLHPTLSDTPDGWRHITTAGPITTPHHPLVDAIVRHYRDARAEPIEPLLDAIAQTNSASESLRSLLDEAADGLLARGVLQSTLTLPPYATDATDVVDAVVEQLVEPDRSHWLDARAPIRACLDRLRAFDSLAPHEVAAIVERARHALQSLWTASGLDGSPPDPPLTLDRSLPYTVTAGEDVWAGMLGATRELFGFHAIDGAAERYRRWTVEDFVGSARSGTALAALAARPLPTGSGSGDVPFGRRDIFRRFAPTPERERWVARSEAAWERALEPFRDDAGVDLGKLDHPSDPLASTPGLAGDLSLRVDGDGKIWLGAARPQPGLFTNRLAAVLGPSPLTCGTGIEPVDVLGADEIDAATTFRPPPDGGTVDARGRVGILPRAVSIWWGRERRPMLVDARGGQPLTPVYPSGGAIGRFDPTSRVLLTLALAHGWEYPSYGFAALPAELGRWRHLPRLALSKRTVLSPQRWTLAPEEVRSLATATAPDRYRQWRRLIGSRGVPALAVVRAHTRRPPVLMPTASPLAVDAVLGTLDPADPQPILIEEPPGDPRHSPIEDGNGHYVAELGVTWFDRDYASWLPAVATLPAIDADDLAEDLIARANELALGWVQRDLKVKDTDAAIVELASLARVLMADRLIARWWFIRKPPGMRARFLMIEPGAEPRIDERIDELVSACIVTSSAANVYEPELARFGGEAGLALTHDHFAASSALVAELLQLHTDRSDLRVVAAAMAHDLFSLVADDRAELLDVWHQLAGAVRRATGDDELGPADAGLATAATATDLGGVLPAAVVEAMAEGRKRHVDIANRLRASTLTVGRRAWLAAVTIFDWNRFGLTTDDLRPLLAGMIEVLGAEEQRPSVHEPLVAVLRGYATDDERAALWRDLPDGWYLADVSAGTVELGTFAAGSPGMGPALVADPSLFGGTPPVRGYGEMLIATTRVAAAVVDACPAGVGDDRLLAEIASVHRSLLGDEYRRSMTRHARWLDPDSELAEPGPHAERATEPEADGDPAYGDAARAFREQTAEWSPERRDELAARVAHIHALRLRPKLSPAAESALVRRGLGSGI